MQEDIQKNIYSTFSSVASSLGYSEVHGMIIASLLAAGKPLSLQEIAKRTGYSLSSISISIDLLEVVGIVRKVKHLGDRRLYVKLEGDLLEGLKKAFLLKVQKEILMTKMELASYKPTPDTERILKILLREVERLEKYIAKLAEVGMPE